MDNTLMEALQLTEQREKYDAACKRMLSEKIILAWLMKQCVAEYANCSVDEITEHYIEGTPEVAQAPVKPDMASPVIRGLSQEDAMLNEKTVTYDIRFLASAPGTDDLIRLIINVEAQNDFYPGYPLIKRGLYYCSRLISAQYGTEFTASHYENIKKVYSIWICMNPPKNRHNTIAQYAITEKSIVGHVEEKPEHYDLMTAIMIALGTPEDENYDGILKLLGVLLSSETSLTDKQHILENDFDISLTGSLEQEVSAMCNLSEGIGEKKYQQGSETTKLAAIRSLMKTLKLTALQAMEALEIPAADQSKYLALLNA